MRFGVYLYSLMNRFPVPAVVSHDRLNSVNAIKQDNSVPMLPQLSWLPSIIHIFCNAFEYETRRVE